MTTVAEALHRRGYKLPEADVADALLDLLPQTAAAGSVSLTQKEQALLAAGSLPTRNDRGEAARASSARTAAAYTALLAGSLTVAELALRIGRDRSTVQRMISGHALYAIRVRGQHRLPAFQFPHDQHPLPGLDVVLAALPADLNPLTVEGFFTAPDPDLRDDRGEPLTPAGWLASGGDPAIVAALAAAFEPR